jgi:alpha-glucuronidase
MPAGFGRSIKSKGRPLGVMAHLKGSVIEVKAETKFLAHALIIAIAKITYDPNYNSYRRGCKIHPVVHNLLATKGNGLRNGGGIPELQQVQDHFNQYKIVAYTSLNCDSIMFEGKVETSDSISLLYDDMICHYHVIGS